MIGGPVADPRKSLPCVPQLFFRKMEGNQDAKRSGKVLVSLSLDPSTVIKQTAWPIKNTLKATHLCFATYERAHCQVLGYECGIYRKKSHSLHAGLTL